ncbi:MAG TPA: FtsW/RodA/SpoVE family cell cycle protein [Chitinophagaceae bacterium]|nr:FtsW/RodA/SpoVE family cell cycle protein [Chitinophagaceae bacterium]
MTSKPGSHKESILFLFLSSALLLVLFAGLYRNLQPALQQATIDEASGHAMLLRPGYPSATLARILSNGNYFQDPKDLQLILDSLPGKLATAGTPDNLGAINKKNFAITAPISWKPSIGGTDFQNRLLASRQRLGFDSALYAQELSAPVAHPSTVVAGSGQLQISGEVNNGGKPMPNILVQLRLHDRANGEDTLSLPDIYARTDARGHFAFTQLVADAGYSVLPMHPGYEFGSRQGTVALKQSKQYSFVAQPHQLRLIGTNVYAQLKAANVLLVRPAASFVFNYWLMAFGLIAACWLVQLVWILRRFYTDPYLLPIILLLTGISMLVMLSIQHPLQDTLYAMQTFQGLLAGLALFLLLSQISIGKLYTSWWFDGLYNFKKKERYQLKGWTWFTLALLLAMITLLAGTGPEGSGVKVNLRIAGISFQPSEITKYLLLLFFAGFFAATEEKIRNLSDIRWRFVASIAVMLAAGSILVLYLLMGDMGPALIVCLTFLIFYSIARGNLLLTLSAAFIYGLLLWLLPDWLATIIAFLYAVLVMGWQGNIKSSRWYGWLAALAEAPVIMIIIVAAFTFGDRLPGVGDRLADRKSIWQNQWNNDVYGGDQLAHGYWTLSSGGLTGQGFGKGYPGTMPAAHTDMVLASIGEELGWLGLTALLMLLFVLLHRCFLHARKSGQPFTFYLCAGIAIATGIQFMLIACGSTGLLPLTGVAVPFLSYGKVSLIINLAALGVVASIAARPGAPLQKEYLRQHYDPVLLTGIAGFLTGILMLSTKLFFIQVKDSRKYIVQEARVVNNNGLPMYSYNPRIEKLTRLLGAGNIYDRNHLLLASSQAATVQQYKDSLVAAGLNPGKLQLLMDKKTARYYPFEEQMFFWVGDYNTRLFWGQSNGFFAEAAYLAALRGFENHPQGMNYRTSSFRADRFTKPVEKEVSLAYYDYSALAPALLQGIDSNNSEVRAIRNKNRDVQLTVDAALQTGIQQQLAASKFSHRRISVVVLDAASGDVLASAMNPLPNIHSPELMQLPERELQRLSMPVTERDLGMTYPTQPGSTIKILPAMAAFNKLGEHADTVSYHDITHDEIIRKNGREEEPYTTASEPFVDMRLAIIRSSNVYFIRIANDYTLDQQMANLYLATGMHVNYRGGKSYDPAMEEQSKLRIVNNWQEEVFPIRRSLYSNPKYYGKETRYKSEFSFLAWGQGQLTSTPVALARMAGAIANNGVLQPSRYALEVAGAPAVLPAGQPLAAKPVYAEKIKEFMIAQSNVPGKEKIKDKTVKVAGKTGTPARIINGDAQYDGWYVFFTPTPDKKSHTVVCIRVEQGGSSANAVEVANEILPVLKTKYLGSF